MKQSPRSGKTPAKLSEAAVRRLNSYALVAGAAGVGMLAQPAEAKIVYTPAHLKIVSNPTGIYNLDLNHDGVNDFAIRDMTFNTGDFIHGALLVDAFGKNAVEGKGFVYALRRGALIGSKQPFSAPQTMTNCVLAATRSLTCFGSWHQATNRYLGFKFQVGGEVHYGWARLSVTTNIAGITATLTGYAYETIPNRGIIAGQTKGPEDSSVEQLNPAALTPRVLEHATLGRLALGSRGLSIWRREVSEVAAQ